MIKKKHLDFIILCGKYLGMNDDTIDLGGVSFIIHYRKDSDDRFFNLSQILRYYEQSFTGYEIIIVNDDSEEDTELNVFKESDLITIHFFKNSDNWKKNNCFNIGTAIAKYNVYGFVDTDALIDPKYMSRATTALHNGECEHIYPYNGWFINIKKEYFEEFLPTFNFTELVSQISTRKLFWENENMNIVHNRSKGGMFLMNKTGYNNIGKFNETFSGWGYEDDNNYFISMKSSNRIGIINIDNAIMWHLEHFAIRDQNPDITENINISMNA